MQMLSLVLLFSFGTVLISGDEECSVYDLPEFSKWVDDGCDENEKKFQCKEGYKMTVSTTCGLGEWNETVQCVKEEEEEVDFCKTNPCLNGGTCSNGQNNYTCQCAGLWKGDICDSCTSFTLTSDIKIQEFSFNSKYVVDEDECRTLCSDTPKCITYNYIVSTDSDYYCALYSKPALELSSRPQAANFEAVANIGERKC